MSRALEWSGVIAFGAAFGIAGALWGRPGEIVFLGGAAVLCLIGWGVIRYLQNRHTGILAEIIVDLSDLEQDAQDEAIAQLSPEDQEIVRKELSACATTSDLLEK